MKLAQDATIPPASGKAFVVKAGQYLRVVTPTGPAVSDLNVFNLDNPRETFWSARTRAMRGAHLTTGDPLFSTPPGEQVMMTITADTVRRQDSPRGAKTHDLLYSRCSRKGQARRGLTVERGCQENLAAAIAEFQLSPDHVHDPFNLFMKTGLDADDRPFYEDPDARAGDYIELRAEIDCLVALTVCTSPCIGDETHALQVQIYDPE